MGKSWFWLLMILILLVEKKRVEGNKVVVPSIIVFGDSSVDSGNNNHISTILRSDFAPYGRDFEGGKATGRFSNGKIVTDFISEAFGIKPTIPAYLDPSYNITHFASGVCFASAGTGYDNATSDVFVKSFQPTLTLFYFLFLVFRFSIFLFFFLFFFFVVSKHLAMVTFILV